MASTHCKQPTAGILQERKATLRGHSRIVKYTIEDNPVVRKNTTSQ